MKSNLLPTTDILRNSSSRVSQLDSFLHRRNVIFTDMMQWRQRLMEIPLPTTNTATTTIIQTTPLTTYYIDLATKLENLRADFDSLCALVQIMPEKAHHDLPLPIQSPEPSKRKCAWEKCWNDKVHILQAHLSHLLHLALQHCPESQRIPPSSLTNTCPASLPHPSNSTIQQSLAHLPISPWTPWSTTDLAIYILMIGVCIARLHHGPIHPDVMGPCVSRVSRLSERIDSESEQGLYRPELRGIWENMADVVFCACSACLGC
ncbi:hypothetical protein N7539_003498 [Penicillium diatomitis]|uniref:Uncharacterized protein n=1 Tax=Penicillium diatomitis TaxID=2819901 RepID=A0A9X0BXR4_9EURO|nr:uncharacterized protein N7539_003498 [Penicillium diatomitis]KAJ5488608.1 hypothetical protein N7539_003498 [Penicillium diatomitis]